MSLTKTTTKSRASNAVTTFLVTVLTLSSSCDAFFRNLMISDTAMARIDPIVNRGEPAAHVHHLTGGGNLNFESTGETLSQSSCTNSILTQDKSAYWAPWLYFEHDNGTFEDVKLALGLTAYYKYEKRGIAGPDVQYSVFPKGLKMLSGTSDKREWKGPWPVPDTSFWGKDDTTQEALAEKAMGFNCMNYEAGKNEPTFAYPFLRNKAYLDENCINGIRAEIVFPSCWDGKNLDSDDHKSHLAFPPLIQDGKCPTTHPVYLPILFYETIWQTNAFKGVPGTFVFSNGDPTGYGYHADFIAAWDDGVQEQVSANSQCTGLTTNGEVETCPVFSGRIQTQEQARSCQLTVPDSIANEQTDGILSGLPGDVKVKGVRYDPGSPPPAGESNAPGISLPGDRTSAAATNAATSSGYYHEPATSVVASPTSASTPGYYSQPVPIAAPSPTTLATYRNPGWGHGSSSTRTYTSGRYIVHMVMVEMTETVTSTTVPVITQTEVINTAPSDVARHHRHARHHAHRRDGHF